MAMQCMPIDTKPGTKVVFAFQNNGTATEQSFLKSLRINVGEILTVEKTVVDGFSTKLYLRELPSLAFNPVNFAIADTIRNEPNRMKESQMILTNDQFPTIMGIYKRIRYER